MKILRFRGSLFMSAIVRCWCLAVTAVAGAWDQGSCDNGAVLATVAGHAVAMVIGLNILSCISFSFFLRVC